MVIVRILVPPGLIVDGENDLVDVNDGATAQPLSPIVLPPAADIVTAPVAPVPANSLPVILSVEDTVMLASATTVPQKLFPSRVADVPITQYILQGFAVPTMLEPTFI